MQDKGVLTLSKNMAMTKDGDAQMLLLKYGVAIRIDFISLLLAVGISAVDLVWLACGAQDGQSASRSQQPQKIK